MKLDNDNAVKFYIELKKQDSTLTIFPLCITMEGGLVNENPLVASNNKDFDEGITNKWSVDPIQVPIGPVTRARAKRFKETLNVLIQHIWAKESSWRFKGDVKSVLQDWVSMVQAEE